MPSGFGLLRPAFTETEELIETMWSPVSNEFDDVGGRRRPFRAAQVTLGVCSSANRENQRVTRTIS